MTISLPKVAHLVRIGGAGNGPRMLPEAVVAGGYEVLWPNIKAAIDGGCKTILWYAPGGLRPPQYPGLAAAAWHLVEQVKIVDLAAGTAPGDWENIAREAGEKFRPVISNKARVEYDQMGSMEGDPDVPKRLTIARFVGVARRVLDYGARNMIYPGNPAEPGSTLRKLLDMGQRSAWLARFRRVFSEVIGPIQASPIIDATSAMTPTQNRDEFLETKRNLEPRVGMYGGQVYTENFYEAQKVEAWRKNPGCTSFSYEGWRQKPESLPPCIMLDDTDSHLTGDVVAVTAQMQANGYVAAVDYPALVNALNKQAADAAEGD